MPNQCRYYNLLGMYNNKGQPIKFTKESNRKALLALLQATYEASSRNSGLRWNYWAICSSLTLLNRYSFGRLNRKLIWINGNHLFKAKLKKDPKNFWGINRNEHGYSDSAVDAGPECIYFIGLEVPPFPSYKHSTTFTYLLSNGSKNNL